MIIVLAARPRLRACRMRSRRGFLLRARTWLGQTLPRAAKGGPWARAGAAAAVALGLLIGLASPAPTLSSDALPGIIGMDNRAPERSRTLPWSAIGRVNRETGGFCTGVLVGSRMALTAAHCLWNRRTNRWIPTDALHFVAGWRGGPNLGHAKVIEVRAAPGLRFDLSGKPVRYADDWALLVLDDALGDSVGSVPILSLDPAAAMTFAARQDVIEAAGYNQDKPHLLYRQNACRLFGTESGGRLLIHDCDLTRGASGAPIMFERDGRYAVIGVQIAVLRRAGEDRGLAVIPSMSSARPVN